MRGRWQHDRDEIEARVGKLPAPGSRSYLLGLEFDGSGRVSVGHLDSNVHVRSGCSQRDFEAAFRQAMADGGEVVFD